MEQITPLTPSGTKNRGVIELLDSHGSVRQRIKVNSKPITIGRGYDNDVILDDPYVCEQHARITLQQDQLLVDDLDSVNGIFINVDRRGDHNRGQSVILASDDVIKVGHTLLRYRHVNQLLKKTRADRHVHNTFWSLQNIKLVLIAFLGIILFFGLESFVEETGEIEKIKVVSQILSGIFMVLVWSGMWSLFGKIMIGKLSFFTHVGIFSLASLFLSIMSVVLAYFFYAIGVDNLYSSILLFLSAVVVCWAIYSHMSFSTRLSSRVLLTTCVLLTSVGLGWFLIDTHMLGSEFSYQPFYEVILKSPDYNFVEGKSLGDFFSETETMQEVITDVIAENAEI